MQPLLLRVKGELGEVERVPVQKYPADPGVIERMGEKLMREKQAEHLRCVTETGGALFPAGCGTRETMTLEEIAEGVAEVAARPKTLLLTALDGTCAHKDLIERAGGTPVSSLADSPEVLILALPELSLDDAEEEALDLADTPGWWDLPCIKGGDGYLLDAKFLENEPLALWILATILHPNVFTDMLPPYSVRMFPVELYKKQDDAEG